MDRKKSLLMEISVNWLLDIIGGDKYENKYAVMLYTQ